MRITKPPGGDVSGIAGFLRARNVPVRLQFGAANSRDPKARYGWRNFRNALIMAAGFLSAIHMPGGVRQFHQWTRQRTEQQSQGSVSKDLVNQALDSLALRDVSAGETARLIEQMYVQLLMFQLFLLATTAGGQMLKKTVTPEELWKELHQRGITGKGLKIAVLDTGVTMTRHLPKHRLTGYNIKNLEQAARPKDYGGHGTAVANIIARGLPDSHILGVPVLMSSAMRESQRAMIKYLKEMQATPEKLTINGLRRCYVPELEIMAKSLKKVVDDGASVVNISLSLDVVAEAMLQAAFRSAGRAVSPGRMSDTRRKYIARLESLVNNYKNQPIDEELKEIYKPWLDALDYAHQKGTVVVLSAGNEGTHEALYTNSVGNVNLLGLVDHPALVVVGSVNSDGVISHFTSEWNGRVKPWIAANGDGELETTAYTTQGPVRSVLSPLMGYIRGYQMKTPQGTSFAAPDVTTVIGMMRSVNPDLTLEEIKGILKKTASEASLSAGTAGRTPYKEKHPFLTVDLLQEKIQRRTGHGMVNRLAAVEEAERLAATREKS